VTIQAALASAVRLPAARGDFAAEVTDAFDAAVERPAEFSRMLRASGHACHTRRGSR
jgi:hypothetical protein